MRILNSLLADEAGFVLSAEAVAVGTLGVVGATVGATALARSANAELEEIAFAIRSLDQSYSIPEQRIGNAFVAGSSFTQKPVKEAHAELRKQIEQDRAAEEKARKAAAEPETPATKATPAKPKKKKKSAKEEDGSTGEATPVLFVPNAQ